MGRLLLLFIPPAAVKEYVASSRADTYTIPVPVTEYAPSSSAPSQRECIQGSSTRLLLRITAPVTTSADSFGTSSCDRFSSVATNPVIESVASRLPLPTRRVSQ